MLSVRWIPRIAALLLLSAAPLFSGLAVADDPPPAAAPATPPASPPTAAPTTAAAAAKPAETAAAPAAGAAPADAAGTAAATPAAGTAAVATPAAPKSNKPPKKRRGGIHPCMTPDPGFGAYDTWSRAPSMGQMIAPKVGGVRKDGGFDLILHFHGHEPVRKEFVKTATGVVLVGIDLGIGSGAYQTGFGAPETFTKLVKSVEVEMAKRSGNPSAHVRKLGLSAWSAGYGALDSILRQTGGKNIDAVILLDGLHTGYDNAHTHTLKTNQLDPFTAFAKRAAQGKTFMFVSHSSIIPPGYSSTTETASYLINAVGGKPAKAKKEDVLGLDMIRKYDKGNFHVRGYDGDDKPDHCAHLGLMAGIMKSHILPRWKSAQNKTASPKVPAAVKTPGKAAPATKAPATKTSPAAAPAKAAPAKAAPAKAVPATPNAKATDKSTSSGVKKVAAKDDKGKKKKK